MGAYTETEDEPRATRVNVRFAGDLRAVLGGREVALGLPTGSTVRDVFATLSARYGESFHARVFTPTGTLEHTIAVFLDGRNIEGQSGLDTALRDDASASVARDVEIFMLPMMEGG